MLLIDLEEGLIRGSAIVREIKDKGLIEASIKNDTK